MVVFWGRTVIAAITLKTTITLINDLRFLLDADKIDRDEIFWRRLSGPGSHLTTVALMVTILGSFSNETTTFIYP